MENPKELPSAQELKDIISSLPFDEGAPPVSLLKYKGEMENSKELPSAQELKEIISNLPFHEGIPPTSLRKYQGVWTQELLMPGIICAQRHFKARPTDILIVSYPKCGTTWLKALTFSTMTRTRHSFADHPLHGLSPHECIPWLEGDCTDLDRLSQIDAISAPRLLSTHLPFAMLPDSIKTSGCRLVYIYRDPKDAVISGWYFLNRIQANNGISETFPLGRLVELFCDGTISYESIWDHALGYWNESLQAHERVLFMTYEELLEDPMEKLTRLAKFAGCPFSKEEVAAGVPAEILSLCSFKNLRDAAHKQDRVVVLNTGQKSLNMKTDVFYMKGTSGAWRSHLSPEMAQRFDQITEEKLRGTGLALGRVGSVGITT